MIENNLKYKEFELLMEIVQRCKWIKQIEKYEVYDCTSKKADIYKYDYTPGLQCEKGKPIL